MNNANPKPGTMLRIPRCTVYPALAVILINVLIALPSRGSESQSHGAAARARAACAQMGESAELQTKFTQPSKRSSANE
ncbi:MAG: hypothetical protein ACI8X5_002685 [Planctomycetota bacterium]|jgi:hypothetical protein